MNVFGKLLSSVSDIFDFNQATLSGCVDIVVVRQRDGTLRGTPFHVRFGKLKVLKSKDKFVKIQVNGQPTNFLMKLGEAGEGFFEEEIVKIVRHQSAPVERGNFNVSEPAYNSDQDIAIPVASAAQTGVSPSAVNRRNESLGKMLNLKHSYSTGAVPKINSRDTYMEIEEPLVKQENQIDIEEMFLGDMTRQKSYTCEERSVEPCEILPKHSLSMTIESPNRIKMIKKIKVRTLRPSSEKLKSLNLKLGVNTVTYTVQTPLQGSQTVKGHIYYWHEDTNIIISDIDGTITKTDLLGHLMPMVGKDWSQPGIAPLYTNIRRNGYQILYLTSRPIGQAKQTKDFLHSVYQDGKMLPHGPLIMSPDRMLPSVKREIIFKRPELFKMAVLKDIRSLFPENHNPFHAGFGNRPTDAIAYNSVGIPLEKVYIVNPKGDIHHHTDAANKSYALINSMVKEMFPSILSDPKTMLAESLDEENVLQIDDKNLMEINVAKVVN